MKKVTLQMQLLTQKVSVPPSPFRSSTKSQRMKKLLLPIVLLLPMLSARTQAYSKHDADSLLAALQRTMPQSTRMHALTTLAEYQVLKPGELKLDFDSAENYISKAEAINTKVRSADADGYILYVRSILAKEKGEREVGREMVKKAIEVLSSTNNKSYFAKANFELATYYEHNKSEELVEMIRLVEIAVEAYRQTDIVERYAYSLEFLGDLYLSQNNHAKSQDALDRSLAAYNSIHHQKLSGVYVLQGTLAWVMANHRQALKYCHLALQNAENTGDTSMQLCQIYNMVATLYVTLKEMEKGMPYYEKAFQVARRYNDTTSTLMLMTNMVVNYLAMDKVKVAVDVTNRIPKGYLARRSHDNYAFVPFVHFYIQFKLSNYAKARQYANEFMQFSETHVIPTRVIYNFYYKMASFLLVTKEYSKIDFYLSKLKGISPNTSDERMYFKMFQFRRDTALKNYPSAIANILAYIKLNDSIFNETSKRQQNELVVEYETIKKADSIQLKNKDILLLTQQNKFQQANLVQDRLYRNISMAGGALLAIILLLVYRQYRQKQKNNILVNKKNEQLQHFLTEKEWLLKEIHHRVKNNLQIVMSLLNSQSAYIDNAPARNAIHDSQRRVHAMSLIHQKLYGSENFSSISLPVYIRELGTYLAQSFDLGQRIHLEYDIAAVEVDVSQAVPLGLILNEAITNSIKYAFPEEMRGAISISLSNIGTHEYLLSIADNGIGINGSARKDSLGMSLMQGLSEDLNGSFSIESNNGTTIKIIFSHQSVVNRRLVLDTPFASSN